jgi:3-deoxy-D-manno-octulosonic-acid transferase
VYLLYSVLLSVAALLALPWYLWKARGGGKYLVSLRQRWGRLPADLNPRGEPSVWIHAVSVGEVLAARALIEPLRRRFPRHRLLVSTTTVTGNAVARSSLSAADGLFFAPFDWPGPVRRALRAVRPALLVLVETELWPNLIHLARAQGARVALVNGRISPRSFPRYRALRRWLRHVLAEVDLFLMQAEPHAERVRQIGAPPERVRVVGNLKFEAAAPRSSNGLVRLLDDGSRRPLWVAGSTVAGEDEAVLGAFRLLRERFPGTRLLIAPRHPERFAEVTARLEAAGLAPRRRTSLDGQGWGAADVVVLDTLGELATVYSLATLVFVGGSLVSAGGHNVLEPAVAGKPVVVGPHMENFQEIADEFRAEGALVQVATAAELGPEVVRLFADPERRRQIGERARALVERNQGALARTVDALAGLVA